MEFEVHESSNDNNQSRRNDGGVDTWSVAWLVLRAEDRRTDYSTDSSCADEGRGGEGALPLAAEVVGLVGEDGGDIGVAGGCCEELQSIITISHRLFLSE